MLLLFCFRDLSLASPYDEEPLGTEMLDSAGDGCLRRTVLEASSASWDSDLYRRWVVLALNGVGDAGFAEFSSDFSRSFVPLR